MTIDDIEDIAIVLMSKHHLIGKGWTFNWNNRKRAFGICDYRKKEISLSKFMFNNTKEKARLDFLDTILHEIAHALAFINDGHCGHGKPWKKWAVKVGANPKATAEVKRINDMAGVKYVIIDTSNNDKIIHRYYRKPNQRMYDTINLRWANGRTQSKGYLKIKKVRN